MSQVWFITGVSSGLGESIALKALDCGFTVIGTVRSRQRAAKQVEKIESRGGKCLELDITNAQACFDIYSKAQQVHGRIDVLVNNAGVSYLGPVEDFTDDEAKAQMEVSYHGPLRLIQVALPGFRSRKSGAIVNITSIAGINGLPGVGLYAASKFALEGMPWVHPTSMKLQLTRFVGLSESLAGEVEEHGIRVLLVEPGQFRTSFLSAFKTPSSKSSMEHYANTKKVFDHFQEIDGKQRGDASKAAARIVEAVAGTGMAASLDRKILRLPLGPDCLERYESKVKSMSDDLEAAREMAMSTDVDE